MPKNALRLDEREEISLGLQNKKTFTDIANCLGRSVSTISREVGTNGGRHSYRAARADAYSAQRRKRPKPCLFQSNELLKNTVESLLIEEKLSPEVISVNLKKQGLAISVETIYQGIYSQGAKGLAGGLHIHLHHHRRTRRSKRHASQKKSKLGQITLIHARPEQAGNRSESGHFEGDLIIGKNNASAIITLFDRHSSFVFLGALQNGYGKEQVRERLCAIYEQMPDGYAKTLTWDQGSEMASWEAFSDETNIPVYFADPHSPWQRPVNENGNGLLRRWLPKGTDLSVYSQADLT